MVSDDPDRWNKGKMKTWNRVSILCATQLPFRTEISFLYYSWACKSLCLQIIYYCQYLDNIFLGFLHCLSNCVSNFWSEIYNQWQSLSSQNTTIWKEDFHRVMLELYYGATSDKKVLWKNVWIKYQTKLIVGKMLPNKDVLIDLPDTPIPVTFSLNDITYHLWIAFIILPMNHLLHLHLIVSNFSSAK